MTYILIGRRVLERGVNKEAKEMIWKIVRETFQEVHNVHLNFVERTFFNYRKKIKAEEGVETKEGKAGEGGRKRNRDEFDEAVDLQNTEINLEPSPTTTCIIWKMILIGGWISCAKIISGLT